MTRRTELLALAERVEKGETGSKIRIDIAVTLGGERGTYGYTRPSNTRNWTHPSALPAWELSIDAQAALPAKIMCVSVEMGGVIVEAAMPGIPPEDWSVGRALTEHAARLAALLRAMAEDAA